MSNGNKFFDFGVKPSVFYSRENQNLFRDFFFAIFGFPSVIFFFFRENIVKTARENTRCVGENFFRITYVKMQKCVREKYKLLFPSNLVKCIFFCTREKKYLPWKYLTFAISYPWKRKSTRKKNENMRKWKLLTARENVEKSVRESHFSFREKVKKRPKMAFMSIFDFQGEKKRRSNLMMYFLSKFVSLKSLLLSIVNFSQVWIALCDLIIVNLTYSVKFPAEVLPNDSEALLKMASRLIYEMAIY